MQGIQGYQKFARPSFLENDSHGDDGKDSENLVMRMVISYFEDDDYIEVFNPSMGNLLI